MARYVGCAPSEVPLVLHPDEFAEMMQEVVPRLVQATPDSAGTSEPSAATASVPNSPRGLAQKRPASRDASQEPERRPLFSGESDEALTVEEMQMYAPMRNSYVEVLMAGFLQKRTQKELPVTGNAPELQAQIQDAKALEWDTVVGKTAVKVHRGAKGRQILCKYSHRLFSLCSHPQIR